MVKCLIVFFVAFASSFAVFGQSNEYYALVKKADSLYKVKQFGAAVLVYSSAFKVNNGKGEPKDRFGIARSWAKANYLDSAFKYLETLTGVEEGLDVYLQKDSSFNLLQNDKRWKLLLDKMANVFKEPNVGDLQFDATKDNPNFYLCNSKHIPQYYGVRTTYKGEKKALKQYFFKNFKPTGKQNGFVTIRFVVNCKGETDRFRVFQIDPYYNQVVLDSALTDQLLKLTKELKDWIQPKYGDISYDSYYYLCFQMEDGMIITITP